MLQGSRHAGICQGTVEEDAEETDQIAAVTAATVQENKKGKRFIAFPFFREVGTRFERV